MGAVELDLRSDLSRRTLNRITLLAMMETS